MSFKVQSVSAQDYSGHRPVLAYAEIITDPLSGEEGRFVAFRQDVGNGQLAHDYVYGDPRRMSLNGGHPGVTFGVKTGFPSSDTNLTNQIRWMYDSIFIWNNQSCADLTLRENAVNPSLTGVIDEGRIQADLTQIGFLGGKFHFPAWNINTRRDLYIAVGGCKR